MALTVNMIQIGRIDQGSKRTPRTFLNMKCANVNNALGDASVECVLIGQDFSYGQFSIPL